MTYDAPQPGQPGQPGPPPPGAPWPPPPPVSSGHRTLFIVLGVVGGLFLLAVVLGALSAFFAGSVVREEFEKTEERLEQQVAPSPAWPS